MEEKRDWVAEFEISLEEKEGKHLPLKQLTAYKLADEFSDYVWDIVATWDPFAKKTVGDQWVRAVDSIGANIAESYGRYFYHDSILFLYYSRGSCFESMFWAEKALKRGLVNNDQSSVINNYLGKLPKEINVLVKIKRTAAKGSK